MSRILANYHTHTSRCKHASGTDRDYVETAVQNNFSVLGFSDHMAWPFKTGFQSPVRMDVKELPDYAASIHALQKEFSSNIRIHLGAECEYFPDFLPWLKEEKEKLDLEYLILGVHCSPNEERQLQFANATQPEHLNDYTHLVIAGMETGMFTYLCHPDLPLKSYPVFDSHVREMSRLICECASALHIPLEYNLAGLRLRGTVPDGYGYTSDAFWQIAAQYKCSAIIAADAHEPDVLNDTLAFENARQKLTNWEIPVIDDVLPE